MEDSDLKEYINEIYKSKVFPTHFSRDRVIALISVLGEEGLLVDRLISSGFGGEPIYARVYGVCYDEDDDYNFLAVWELDDDHEFVLAEVEIDD